MSPRDTRPDEDVAVDLTPADDTALADAGLPTEGGQDGAPAPTGAGSARRPERRASLTHPLYNREGGLGVVRHNKLIFPLTPGVVPFLPPSLIFPRFKLG